MRGQRDMKRVGRAEKQMEQREIMPPIPNQMTNKKSNHDQHGIERKKIRRESDEKVCFRNDDVSTARGHTHFFHLAAEQPRPNRVGEFMTEYVKPHWFGQQ